MANRNTAKQAPPPRPIQSLTDIDARLNEMLVTDFAMQPLGPFAAVLEGRTDVQYLRRAAELAISHHGEDLLAIPAEIGIEGQVTLCSPGTPGQPHRGGVPQMVRLARELKPYFVVDRVMGIVFVLDHDTAGLEAKVEIEGHGFRSGDHIITLDPREHPDACANKQVVIEDLLSLDIQKNFFASDKAWCSVDYEDGVLKRFRWSHQSKSALCDFICKTGSAADFAEVIHLLRRIRRSFAFASGT